MNLVFEFSCAVVAALDSLQTLSGKSNNKNVAQCVRAAGWIFFFGQLVITTKDHNNKTLSNIRKFGHRVIAGK